MIGCQSHSFPPRVFLLNLPDAGLYHGPVSSLPLIAVLRTVRPFLDVGSSRGAGGASTAVWGDPAADVRVPANSLIDFNFTVFCITIFTRISLFIVWLQLCHITSL